MTQITDLFQIIKQQLRSRGLTYRQLAPRLGLSEATIKRLFSQKDISLGRLEELCACLELSLTDLFVLLDKQRMLTKNLSEHQEKELVSDRELLLVAVCVLNHWTFSDILTFYTLSEHALIRHVARLDQMKIIELQPGNRFKRLVAPEFHWIPDGPIQRFFQKTVQEDFFTSRFDKPSELFLVRSGMLSEQDNLLFQQALIKTAKEFVDLCRDTIDVPIDQRHGTALVLAMRPWVPQIFDSMKR